MSDNKSQSIDHDTSSIPGHTESKCRHCDNAGGHSGHPSTKCPECGRWSAPPWPANAVITESDDDCTLPPVWANIVFDLETTEGERRLREMLDAPKMKLVLLELDNYLRDLIKYGDDKDGVELTTLEMVRKALWHICDYHGIRLDEE